MRKITVIFAVLLATLMLPLSQSAFATDGGTGEKIIYFTVDSAESEGGYLVSATNAEFGAAGLGMTATKNARLIKTDIGEVVYRFDMDDDTTSALMAIAARYINVYYGFSQDGEYYSLTPIETPSLWSNHAVVFSYELNEDNVFAQSNASKVFYIKVKGGIGSYDGWLFALSVTSDDYMHKQDVAMGGIASTRFVYHYEGLLYGDPANSSDPLAFSLYLLSNTKVKFKVRFDVEKVISVAPSYVSRNGDYEKKTKYSLDGVTWADYEANTDVLLGESGWFYFELQNTAAEDLILQVNFLTVQQDIEYNDLDSQENKDFGYDRDLERQHVTPLPEPEGFPDAVIVDEPQWYSREKGCGGQISIFASVSLFALSLKCLRRKK